MHFWSSQFCLIIVWVFLQARSISNLSSIFLPFLSIVQSPPGIRLTPVWSQLKIKSSGMLCSSTHFSIRSMYSCFVLSKSFGFVLAALVPFRLVYPRRFNTDSAHGYFRLVHRATELFGKFPCRILNAIFHGISCHFCTNPGRIIIVIPTFTLCATFSYWRIVM